ncbi:hypothetical protein BTZ20_0339 [Rhodococcus sp. MTM3W5.2]|nr:hypothetical protein BTZ20_0339 [Rhodococcus sp. MTM3W5.2]
MGGCRDAMVLSLAAATHKSGYALMNAVMTPIRGRDLRPSA